MACNLLSKRVEPSTNGSPFVIKIYLRNFTMSTNKKVMAFALTTVFSGACLASAHAAPETHTGLAAPAFTAEGKMAEQKCGEGKCGHKKMGEHKCGEGKCGDKMKSMKKSDKMMTGAKAAEHKCGEGKCGAAKQILDAAQPL